MRALAVIAACLALCGCFRTAPRVSGGGAAATLSMSGPVATIAAPENPRQRSEQIVERTIMEEWTPVAVWEPRTETTAPPVSLSAPASETGPEATAPAPHLLRRTVTERAQTSLGASQDLAGILKAASDHWRAVVAVLLGIGLIAGGWFAYRNEWPTPAALLVVAGLACILTLNPLWAILGPILAALVTLAYHAARARLP